MSIITADTFQVTRPKWATDPELSDSAKAQLFEWGLGELSSFSEGMDLHDVCFECGKMLSVPYVYWHGCSEGNGPRGLSLHAECARHLAKGITRDADNMS